jgi:gamma-glutamyltranspeptidase / glutathione hydrolase
MNGSAEHTKFTSEKHAAHAMVVTPHREAAFAAEQALRAGGNAVDASVAAMMTLCVVMPGMVGLGGYGGSAVIYLAGERRTTSIDFTAVAPLNFRSELYNAKFADSGPLSITVPTVLAGLDLALRHFGKLSWRDVSMHAAHVAANGFPMHELLKRHLHNWIRRADPCSIRTLLGDGQVPQLGEIFVQTDLAKLIRRIGREGIDAFYHGEVPRMICSELASKGGILCVEDFSHYRPMVTEPISATYRGHELFTPPPPSGGVTTMAILKTLERLDVSSMPRWSADYLHLFAEAAKLCWRDRHATIGDSPNATFSMEQILSDSAADARALRIAKGVQASPAAQHAEQSPHTSNVLAVDREGNVVSMTATQGLQFGSQVVIEGLGLVMNHGMSRFSFVPGSPNAPAPGKRMQHNMAPMIILQKGEPRFAIGLPGGTKIVTVTAQLAVNLIDHGVTPAEAIVAPRVHVEADEPVLVSDRVPRETIDALTRLGHQIKEGDEVGGDTNVLCLHPGGDKSGASGAGADAVCAI